MKKICLVITLILSCTALAQKEKVLVVLSASDGIVLKEGNTHATGYFLNELAIPLSKIMASGYEVDFATPGGVSPKMDKQSDALGFFKDEAEYKQAKDLVSSLKQLNKPLSLKSLTEKDLEKYAALFVPGGHAPMSDLYKDAEMGRLLKHFHGKLKPTALICHGPVALLAAEKENWIYKGYNMTVFSKDEEQQNETPDRLGGHVSFYPSDALTAAGGNVTAAKAWTSHVVTDRELITGQNPMSDQAFSFAFLEALSVRRFEAQPLKVWPKTKQNSNTAYIVSNKGLDFKTGYSTFYVGSKKKSLSKKEFSKGIRAHIADAKTLFEKFGLRGYLAYIGDDYEIAYLNWPDQESANKAFTSEEAKPFLADAQATLEGVVFGPLSGRAPEIK